MNISTWASKSCSWETWYSGSSAPIMRLLHSKILWRSSLGTPISSAMTSRGSSAAMSTTKSLSPWGRTRSRMPVVSSRMWTSIRPIILGVKPRFTSRR